MKIRKLYLCNGKGPCSVRPDGKHNEYCMHECKHTTDKTYAKHKDESKIKWKKTQYEKIEDWREESNV